MPPLPGNRKRVQHNGNGQSVALKATQNVLTQRTGSSGGMRGRREAGEVTPTLSKADSSTGEDLELCKTISHSSVDGSHSKVPTSTPERAANGQGKCPRDAKPEILLTPPLKQWHRDGKRHFKPQAREALSDGPHLQPNTTRTPSHRYSVEDDQISYAQAASNYKQLSSINISQRTEDGGYTTPQTSREASTEISSVASSPVFDSAEDSSSGSDDETHRSSRSSIATDDRLDERLTDPTSYFADLQHMESKVAQGANLDVLSKHMRQRYPRDGDWTLTFPFPPRRFLHGSFKHHANRDEEVLSHVHREAGFGPVSRNLGKESSEAGIEYWTFHVLECRNVLLSIMSNIELMRQYRYLQDFFSILSLDEDRKNVVNLFKIDMDWIHGLFQSFETALTHMCSFLRHKRDCSSVRIAELQYSLTQACEYLLQRCSLPRSGTVVGKWRNAVMTLNLAAMSYAGAHQSRFDLEHLQESLDYCKFNPSWTYDTSSKDAVMLRYRRLRCLDGLLSSPVWTFQRSRAWQETESLFVSCEVDTLADIWGPVWAIKDRPSSENVREYCFENGHLRFRSASREDPPLQTEEVMLHWYAPNQFIGLASDSATKTTVQFSESSRLLIGGGSLVEVTTSQLKETPTCPSRQLRVLEDFKSRNLVSELGTSTARRVLAQESVSAQIGYSGITLGAQRMYKRQQGVTYKQALCAQWKHGGPERSPQVMERHLGVEISFCSGNARRRRLKDIFASSTMKKWLENCVNRDIPCHKAFQEAMEDSDPRAFARLWKNHKEWREDLRLLVSWCLEGLAHTKVDEDGSLGALWMPRADRSYLVKVKQSKHAWTSFLEDSPIQCAFPIMSGKCLYSDYSNASVCQAAASEKSAYSIFETAIVINELAPKPKGLELCPPPVDRSSDLSRYSLRGVRLNDRIPLHAGRLRIRELFRNTRLLVEWEQGVTKKIFDAVQSVSKTVGREALFHREHTDDKELPSKPISVFIVSQNKDSRP